jgi:twinkle protein
MGFSHHEPCTKCGSSDAAARYANGDLYCHACLTTIERGGRTTLEAQAETVRDWTPLRGEAKDKPARGLTAKTLAHWDYQCGEGFEVANYYDPSSRELLAQKVRRSGKQFSINGRGKDLPLYGEWLYPNGRHLTITEGEIDALSMSQAFDLKWPVVSLPNGAQSAAKALASRYDYLDRFDTITLMFDQDKPGRDAVEECAPLLPPGKVKIASLPEKDANEVLVKHGAAKLVQCFWQAVEWRPDGIVPGSEFTLAKVRQAAVRGYTLPYPLLQERMLGLRKKELTLWTAGSGIGKSTMVRELGYLLHQQGCTIGNVFLEEGNVETVQAYVAIDNNVPLGRLRHQPDMISDEQWDTSLQRVVHHRMWFYNHFGSLGSANLLTRLRYLATVCKCDFIILDHVSIVTSGMESSSEGERKDIDILMTRLRSLVEETGVGIIAVVHLKRVTGRSFNEGAQVSLSDLRGSAALEQLSNNVLAIERDQQSDEPTKMALRVLKCRETGETGAADELDYDRATGRIVLASDAAFKPMEGGAELEKATL